MKMQIHVVLLVFTAAYAASNQHAGYFWHVTDYHYDTTYGKEMRSCNGQVPVLGIYGDYWCDSPWKLVIDSITAMANIKTDVDFIIWTGDTVAHIKDEFLNETYNVDLVRNITELLKAQFPSTKIYATMGNHDWYPSNEFTNTGHSIYNGTAEMWEDWIGSDQMYNFRKGAYYTTKTQYGLRIVGLNTNLYYTSNHQTVDIEDPAGQFAWLEQVLDNARTAGDKVLLTAHIPPGIHTPGIVEWFYKYFNTRFIDITRQYADVITSMHFGHDHADSFKLLYRDGGGPGIPMFMAPSITPWRYKIPQRTGKPHNPAIRLVKYNRNDGLTLDIQQYYMDLRESNSQNASNWTIAYSFVRTYGVTDLSAVQLDSVITKMGKNETMLDQFIRFNTVLANGESTVNLCDDLCRARYICGFQHFDKSTFDSCAQDTTTSGSARIYNFPFAIILLSLFVSAAPYIEIMCG